MNTITLLNLFHNEFNRTKNVNFYIYFINLSSLRFNSFYDFFFVYKLLESSNKFHFLFVKTKFFMLSFYKLVNLILPIQKIFNKFFSNQGFYLNNFVDINSSIKVFKSFYLQNFTFLSVWFYFCIFINFYNIFFNLKFFIFLHFQKKLHLIRI